MAKDRHEKLKLKSQSHGLTTNEYLEILIYDQPEYHEKIMNLIHHWEEMDEHEFEQLMDELLPDDQELVLQSIYSD